MNVFKEKLTTEELNKVFGGNGPAEDTSTDVDFDDAETTTP